MSVSEAFREQIRELLADLGAIRFKAMFGGAGLYAGDLFFAIAADDVLYLKVDDANEAAFVEAGSHPFRAVSTGAASGRRRPTALHEAPKAEVAYTLRYWRMPDSALDDPDEAVGWARLGIEAALRAVARKKPGKPRKSKGQGSSASE